MAGRLRWEPMMLVELREQVLAANLALPAHRLVTLTWGNVSGIDRSRGLVAIKASGVSYSRMTAADVVMFDLGTARSSRAPAPIHRHAHPLALYGP